MLSLLKGHGVDLDQPLSDVDWIPIDGKDENGNPHREYYPSTEPHESQRVQAQGVHIDYQSIIEERAKEVAEREAELEVKDKVIDTQEDQIESLLLRLAALERNQLPLEKMTPPQLKSIAKSRGLDFTGLKTKNELLALLNDE